MPTHTVFYSWQSDLPNSTNRGFIEDCLSRALKQLSQSEQVDLDPCLDRDTSGFPGAPDIATTIFEKIEACDVFVCDVSVINAEWNGRKTSNPNVLIELGYAAKCLGWDRILCLRNRSYGSIEYLPFDIRQRRILVYELSEGEEKSVQRTRLVGVLKDAIQDILHAPEETSRLASQQFLSELSSDLITVIIYGSEFGQRKMKPWLDSLRVRLESAARSIRQLALTETAIKESMTVELDELAETLEEVAHGFLDCDSGDELGELVVRSVEMAQKIKHERIDVAAVSKESLKEVRTTLLDTNSRLTSLANRAVSMASKGRIEELQSDASDIGLLILRIGHYDVDRLREGLSQRLREIGFNLHVVETMELEPDEESLEDLITRLVRENSQKLNAIVSELPKGA